ncbi:MAG TPA: hypothetical protein VJ723_00070 [Candidatus Angelobacter sp.]|nr:hypothetical protein [Candidatus Angelobacter sp.]
MNNANPVTHGFRAVLRDPVLFIVEVAWRWVFGLIAFALLYHAFHGLSQSVAIAQADAVAWRSRDVTALVASALRIADESGGKIFSMAAFILSAITLLWVFLGSIGRVITLKRLSHGDYQVRSLTIFMLQVLRAFSMWIGTLVLLSTITVEGQISTGGDTPNVFLYYLLVLPSVLIIGILWTMMNWYLSLAPACVCDPATGAFKAIRLARKLGRLRRAEFGSVSVLSVLLRLAGLMVVFVLCVATSGWMGPSPNAYAALVFGVSLAYFAFADFLFAVRQASFVEIVMRPDEQGTATLSGPMAGTDPAAG